MTWLRSANHDEVCLPVPWMSYDDDHIEFVRGMIPRLRPRHMGTWHTRYSDVYAVHPRKMARSTDIVTQARAANMTILRHREQTLVVPMKDCQKNNKMNMDRDVVDSEDGTEDDDPQEEW